MSHHLRNKCKRSAIALMLGGISLNAHSAQPDTVKTGQPNIVVILADDLALPDVSAYGYQQAPTPNIDKLAKNGTRFDNAYVAASVCAVSRAAIMTGRFPQHFGFVYNLDGKADPDKGLPLKERTIANYLKNDGYNTAAIGKWHLGFEKKYYPTNRGFDYFYGFLAGESLYVDEKTSGIVTTHSKFDADKKMPFDHRTGPKQIFTGKDMRLVDNLKKYLTDDFTTQAENFISEQKEEHSPFFLYMAYNAPHWPMQVPKKYYSKFSYIKDPVRRTYVAMISNLDDNIGKLMKKLKKTNQENNTLIFFLSDNGCPSQLGFCNCNSSLGSGKFTYLEGGIHIPYIVSWPGHIASKSSSDAPVSSLDILPTILKAANPKQKTPKKLDGIDITNILKSPEKYHSRDLLFGQYPVYAMRQANWKLWMSEDEKITELYDLAKDPAEKHNVAHDNQALTESMTAKLVDWQSKNHKPRWDLHNIYKNRRECEKNTEGLY